MPNPPALFDLTGHVALVTGGNGGIGLGMAKGLAQAGAAVAVWGTNPDKNAAAADELRGLGVDAEAFRCDVSDEEQVKASMAATLERFGRVDSCFANAGIGGGGRFTEMSLDEWRRVQRVNSEGAFLTLQAAAKHMVERGDGGSLVGISSVSAVDGAPLTPSYAHSKGGLIAMIRGLAVGMARYGIRANAILPGWIATDMTAAGFDTEGFKTKVLPRVPHRRWGRPEDFSAVAVYLASPASSYHTGDTLVIDGGYTIF
jgi:NAD(P)-dependent dehydrogenase (short-subunit alcohol dehydrogenase family)